MEHPHIWGLTDWQPLARGGLAQVWEARQTLLARLVAVKVYHRDLVEGDYGAFAREAAAIGRLADHPGVVTAYNAGFLPDDRPYLVMELCPGGSLTQRLDPVYRPTEEQVRSIGIRVADALAAVHAHGVVHRDVKPANILFDGFGHPRLADFGLAVEVGTAPTAAAVSRVTPAYAPPEALGAGPATEAADVYSLAATLSALLAGRPPRRVGPAVGLDQILEVETRPAALPPGVNWFLAEALTTALSSDPGARPSAAGFRDQLCEVPGSRTFRRPPRVAAADRAPLALVRQDSAPTRQPPVSKPRRAAAGPRPSAEPEQAPRRAAVSDQPRERRSRRAGVLVLAAALVAVAVSGVAWVIAEPASSGAPAAITQAVAPAGSASRDDSFAQRAAEPSAPTSTPAADDDRESIVAVSEEIRLRDAAHSAEPFQTVPLRGTYSGGADTFVRVQRWEDGAWQTFPVPARTDRAGAFTAYVELGQPRRYRLRVVDPQAGVTSDPFVLVIR